MPDTEMKSSEMDTKALSLACSNNYFNVSSLWQSVLAVNFGGSEELVGKKGFIFC